MLCKTLSREVQLSSKIEVCKTGSPSKSQKEGQEDKGNVKELEGALHLAVRKQKIGKACRKSEKEESDNTTLLEKQLHMPDVIVCIHYLTCAVREHGAVACVFLDADLIF